MFSLACWAIWKSPFLAGLAHCGGRDRGDLGQEGRRWIESDRRVIVVVIDGRVKHGIKLRGVGQRARHHGRIRG